MDEMIPITSAELVEYTVLARRLAELDFKKGFLLRHEAAADDSRVKEIEERVKGLDFKLGPTASKINRAELVMVVPNAPEINRLSDELKQYSANEFDDAIMKKSGPAYELMSKRAEKTRVNFDNREELARLNLMLSTLAKHESERIKQFFEGLDGKARKEIDIASLTDKKQHDMVWLANRMGYPAFVVSGKFIVDAEKKGEDAKGAIKWENETDRLVPNGPKIWLSTEKAQQFDENEKKLEAVNRRIQARTAEKQVRKFSDEEMAAFEALQKEYMDCLNARKEFAEQAAVGEREAKVPQKKPSPSS